MFGVLFNAIYDIMISYIQKEELRFSMKERIAVCFLWPLYVVLMIINLIKTIINGSNEDN